MNKRLIWFSVGAGALAAFAGLIWLGNRRVTSWETLEPTDAGEGGFVTLPDGTQMHCISRGPSSNAPQNSPVILIHGLMDSAFHWHKNIDALAEQHQVWAIDLIGFGFSSHPTQPCYSLKTFARQVREFMDAQGIARANFIGHSLGGAVALELAHDNPARVDKLILIVPATCLRLLHQEIKLAVRASQVFRAIVGWGIANRAAHMQSWRSVLGHPNHFDYADLSIHQRAVQVKGTTDAIVAMLGSPRASDLPAGLSKIVAPVLIVWGEQDRAVPLQHGKYHERALPNAQLVVFKDAGHIPQIEYPAQMNQMMLDFLACAEVKTANARGA